MVQRARELQPVQGAQLHDLKSFSPEATVAALETLFFAAARPLSLHEPRFAGNEWAYLKECLDSGWVSSLGAFVDRFEALLCEFTGVRHAVACVNGTAALHLCLRLADVQPNEEVLVPTLTFVATANAVAHCGAVPHFVDSEETTLGVDARKLEDHLKAECVLRTDGCFNRRTGARIRVLVPMHTFGHPADMDPLLDLCRRFRLTVIEDAAESLGSWYKDRHTGNFGTLAALSFNGNKVVTTGGGGAILTNDPDLGRHAKHLTTTARLPHRWSYSHDEVGYNYRMPNINAALGCAQMEQLPDALEAKRALARAYTEVFRDVGGIRIFTEAPFARSNYWLNTLVLEEHHAAARDRLLELTHQAGILTRPAWTLMHRLPMYKSCPRMDLSVAESLERRIINLPSSAALGIRYSGSGAVGD